MKIRLSDTRFVSLLGAVTGLSLMLSVASCSRTGSKDISASGTIEATEINVASKAGGEIKALFVDEGSILIAGDTLAVVDHANQDLQLKQAEAGVELADAQL